MSQRSSSLRWVAYKISGFYLLAGLIWIYASDRLLALTVQRTGALTQLQLLKGWGFVLVTTGLLYGLMRRYLGQIQQTQRALQMQADQCYVLFEHSPYPMWVYDLETLRFLAVNQAAIEHYGYSRAEFLDMTICDIHPAAERSRLQAALPVACLQPSYTGQWRHRQRDGSLIEVLVTANSITYADRRARLVVLRDITQYQQAEAALRQSEERYRSLVIATSQAVWLDDANGQARSAIGWQSLTGQSETELQGNGWLNAVHPDDRDRVQQIWQTAVTEQRFYEVEYRLLTVDGEEREVLTRGVPIRSSTGEVREWIGTCTDMTEQRRAEAALKLSEERFRLVLDHSPIAMFTQDRDLKYTWLYNPRLGFDVSDTVGKTDPEIFLNPIQAAALVAIKRQVLQTGLGLRTEAGLDVNGYTRYYDLVLEPLFDASGQVAGLTGVATDITDRKQIELAQQQREQYFRALTENSSDIIVLLDATGVFLYASPSAERLLGYMPAEVVGKNALEFVPPEDAPIIVQTLTQAIQNPGISQPAVEYRVRHHSGQWRTFEAITTSLLHNPIVQGVVVNCRDVSDRRRVQNALQESQSFLEQAQEVAHLGSWICTLEGDLQWSKEVYQIFGVEPDQFDGLETFLNCIHPDDRARVAVAYESTICQQQAYSLDHRIVRTDQSIRWVYERAELLYDDQGKAVKVLGIVQDITDRKQAETEILQLNEHLEALVAQRTAELLTFINALPDYIYVVDRAEMRMPFCNNQMAIAAQMGSKDEVQGKTIFECFPPEQAAYFAEQNRRVFETGETLHLQESFSLPAGNLHLDTYKIPLKNAEGEVYALIGSSRDITELIEARQALQARSVQLEAANRELDSFSYSVSHDLRSPLRHINGFVTLLSQQLEQIGAATDPKVTHCLDVIVDSSQKMTLLIDGLLALSRVGRQQMNFQPIDLRRLVDRSIELVQSNLPDSQSIEFRIGALPPVTADATLLQQVFSNLIDNAVKFSRHACPSRIEIGALEDKTLFVKDNGVGFEMTSADQLFGAFQRLHTQSAFEGTGIGLAIVQRIIHRHGGQIWAVSQPQQGATFYFKLREETPAGDHSQ